MKEFRELNLKPELLEALKLMNFSSMTEVQELAIPAVLNHKDLVVRSKTGSGKTGAFLVPIFQMLEPRGFPQALIIVPTRELAIQVAAVAHKLSGRTRLRSTVVYGGASINMQVDSIRRGSDIIIGTPGRIIDLTERGALRFDRVRFLVLDEADMMLDMGFIDDVERIMSTCPRERQTLLLSATMPKEIHNIARRHMSPDAVKLTVGAEEEITVTTITHNYFFAEGKIKFAALLAYIDKFNPKKCIIFTSTQRESEFVHRFLHGRGLDAIVMHGGMTQAKREYSLRQFKEHSKFLIATNLASRGLDIPDISDIINFDAPDDPRIYTHRVGRSARMGKDGRAFTLFRRDQRGLMEDTSIVANVKMNNIELDLSKYRDIELPFQEHRSGGFRGGRDFHGREGGRDRGFGRRLEFRPGGNRNYQGGHREGSGGGHYQDRHRQDDRGGGDRAYRSQHRPEKRRGFNDRRY